MQQHLNRRQVCELLNCSKKKFYELVSQADPLPAYKLGNGPRAEWRIDPDKLQEWLDNRKQSGPVSLKPKGLPGRKTLQYKPNNGRSWEMIIPEKTAR